MATHFGVRTGGANLPVGPRDRPEPDPTRTLVRSDRTSGIDVKQPTACVRGAGAEGAIYGDLEMDGERPKRRSICRRDFISAPLLPPPSVSRRSASVRRALHCRDSA